MKQHAACVERNKGFPLLRYMRVCSDLFVVVEISFLYTHVKREHYISGSRIITMSIQGSITEDDSFSQRLLRPWSFASLDHSSPSTLLPVTDEARNKSAGTYNQVHRRHNDLGAWAQYSSSARKDSSTEELLAVGEGGWWNQQMLVDRSLRYIHGPIFLFHLRFSWVS